MQTHRYRPCRCHKLETKAWPWAAASIELRACMRRCPYCGERYKTAELLLQHLQTEEYRARKLRVTIQSEDQESTPEPETPALSASPSADLDIPHQHQSPELPNVNLEILLESLSDFPAKTQALVKSIALSTLDTISAETQALWTQSTSTWPRLFPSEECFNSKPPTSTQLLLSTLDIISPLSSALPSRLNTTAKSQYKQAPAHAIPWHAYRRGEIDDEFDPRVTITQLYEPDPQDPIALIGLNVPVFKDKTLTTPLALSEFVEAFEETNQQLLLTPKFCFTDLHIDSSSGISLPLHCTRKLWLLFPPTAHNLHSFSLSEGRKAKLTRIGSQLEGGLICSTSSAEAIYLPVGCIHAVFTLHGGFLAAIDFNTPDSCATFARLFKEGLDVLVGKAFAWECRERYVAALDLALEVGNNIVMDGVWSWVELGERAEEWIEEENATEGNKILVGKLRQIWKEFFAGRAWKMAKEGCPCGEMRKKEDFREHLKTTHFLGLLDDGTMDDRAAEEQQEKKAKGNFKKKKKKKKKAGAAESQLRKTTNVEAVKRETKKRKAEEVRSEPSKRKKFEASKKEPMKKAKVAN